MRRLGKFAFLIMLLALMAGCGTVAKNTDTQPAQNTDIQDVQNGLIAPQPSAALPADATINAYCDLPLRVYNNRSFSIKQTPTDPSTQYAIVGIQSLMDFPDPLPGHYKIIVGSRNDRYGYASLYYFSLKTGAIYTQARGPAGIMTQPIAYGPAYLDAVAKIQASLTVIRNGNYYYKANPELLRACEYMAWMQGLQPVYGGDKLIMYNSSVFSSQVRPEDQTIYYALIGNQTFGPDPLPLPTHNQLVAGWKSFKYDYWDLYFFNLDSGDLYRQKDLHGKVIERYTKGSPAYKAALSYMAAYLKIVRDEHLYMGVTYSPAHPNVAQSYIYINKVIGGVITI